MNEYDMHQKKKCRYSDEILPKAFLDLGIQPLANNYVAPEDATKDEFKCPLSLTRAPKSGLVQLTHAAPADLMFSHYLYVSSTTKTFQEHFAAYAKAVRDKLSDIKNPLAVDIGSNDGLLVSCYQNNEMRAVGVDPAKNLATVANEKGRPTINRYFDGECVKEITQKHGKAHAISANNVFAHIDDIQSVCRNVVSLLDDQGIFVIEFPYIVTMLEEMLFDMIYHEHVSYIAVNSLSFLLEQHGMQIFHIDKVSSHGGSLRVFIQKEKAGRKIDESVTQLLKFERENGYLNEEAYENFAQKVLKVKHDFRELIQKLKKEGKRIIGYGAPAKASTLLNFYELSPQEIDFVIDDNPLKQGLLIPGVHIPVRSSDALEKEKVDVIVIFAWNFAAEILKKIGHLREKGVEFIIPLPVKQSNSTKKNTFQLSINQTA
jgi:SAM-dependent methyltransferase